MEKGISDVLLTSNRGKDVLCVVDVENSTKFKVMDCMMKEVPYCISVLQQWSV